MDVVDCAWMWLHTSVLAGVTMINNTTGNVYMCVLYVRACPNCDIRSRLSCACVNTFAFNIEQKKTLVMASP